MSGSIREIKIKTALKKELRKERRKVARLRGALYQIVGEVRDFQAAEPCHVGDAVEYADQILKETKG